MRLISTMTVITLTVAGPAFAQAPAQPPTAGSILSRVAQGAWNNAKRDIVESADQMPEASYTFKPVDSVRTFGQIIAHVADTNYFYCARAKGEASPFADDHFEKAATTKDAVVKALADSVSYCDAVYNGLTEASVVEMVKAGNGQAPRVAPLFTNAGHNIEHYGNLVTYFRIKGMVPPSTKREGGS